MYQGRFVRIAMGTSSAMEVQTPRMRARSPVPRQNASASRTLAHDDGGNRIAAVSAAIIQS
jgi:hypothetical protein